MSQSHSTNSSRLAAGFGRRDITPSKPCFLVGYPHVERTSTGTNDPLFASALCLKNGKTALVFLSMDWVFVPADWTATCRARIHEETGIPAANIMIGATHTHSGPHVAEVLAWRDDPVVPPVDADYLAAARESTVEAVVEAWENLTAAEAAWTTADVSGLAGGNRIDPNGPEDPEAGLLLVRDSATQKPLAVLSIYGMHPTVLHEDSTLFSGDFIAYARQTVEQAFPGVGMVYLNGVCGNQSPRRVVRAQTFAEAERIGQALGERLAAILRETNDFQSDVTLAAAVRSISLEGKTFPSVADAEENLIAARRRYAELKAAGAEPAKVRTAECTVFGAEEVFTLAKAEQSGDAAALRERYRSAEIQLFRVGDRGVPAWPGEFFVEFGLELKKRAPFPLHPVTMANAELQGYVVTPEAEAANGYEAQMSLFPSSAGKLFVDTTVALATELL